MSHDPEFVDDDGGLSPEADAFLERAVAEFSVKQNKLNDVWDWNQYIGWSFDLTAAKLRLQMNGAGDLEADAFLIGTYCQSDESFEWTWNNPRYDATARRKSLEIRELGLRLDISYLEAGMVPAPGSESVSYLGALAVKATDSDGLFWSSEGEVQALIVVSNIKRTRH